MNHLTIADWVTIVVGLACLRCIWKVRRFQRLVFAYIARQDRERELAAKVAAANAELDEDPNEWEDDPICPTTEQLDGRDRMVTIYPTKEQQLDVPEEVP